MADPLESLRLPPGPVDPDPAFATRLRARVTRALALPKGVTVSNLTIDLESEAGVAAAPAGGITPVAGRREDAGMQQGDVAYVSLFVPDLGRARAFFGRVLGWAFGPGSSEQAAQVEGLSLSHGVLGGQERSNLLMCFAVDDVDAAVERVWAAGGRVEEPTDEPYGRMANCVDDQGMAFCVFTPPPGVSPRRGPAKGERHGDPSYLTIEVVDSARTRKFFGEVLGWRFSPGRIEDGWGVDGVVPMSGLSGGHAVDTVVPMYRVDDIAAAVERVRAAGGTATDPVAQPYGWTSECVDDQGTRFYLGEL
jgi:predicted enzyme related to lactoylglutathione lyase